MKPIDKLKKGLKKLQDETRARKAVLVLALNSNQAISQVDEDWLDHAGNLVDEERVVDELDKALDYESTFEGLDPQDKLIAEKLAKLAAGNEGSVDPPKKRKRMVSMAKI
ncbi:hypothetical protein JVT61DRAFT_3244 [Boletus reticuloceps]|uniref:Uncharacterized protein n=1 Tax=Boletus reticuloceps TaxID=495285 RepID=A0A8I2YPE2_9AGAM|nr:hypothetical protein JVT61DRAFT_3244 [Boletus reticuloceps]